MALNPISTSPGFVVVCYRIRREMHGESIANLIASQIKDQDVRWLSENRPIGGIDQITDNTDFRLFRKGSADGGKSARSILRNFFQPNIRLDDLIPRTKT